jgi:hypothetical protein
METPNDTVTIVLSGEVPLGDFAKAVAQFNSLINNLAIASGIEDVTWVIHDLEFSSAIATARGSGPIDSVQHIVRDYEMVGSALEKDEPIPFSDSVRKAAYGLRKIVRGKIESISLETARREAIIRTPTDKKRHLRIVDTSPPVLFSAPITSLGSIYGRVQTLTSRGGLRFTLYDLLHDKAVSCYLKEGYEEIMRDAWGKLAVVTGMITRDPFSGRPLSIRQVSNVVEEKGTPANYRDARGASPPLNNISPEDAIRRLRDAK